MGTSQQFERELADRAHRRKLESIRNGRAKGLLKTNREKTVLSTKSIESPRCFIIENKENVNRNRTESKSNNAKASDTIKPTTYKPINGFFLPVFQSISARKPNNVELPKLAAPPPVVPPKNTKPRKKSLSQKILEYESC